MSGLVTALAGTVDLTTEISIVPPLSVSSTSLGILNTSLSASSPVTVTTVNTGLMGSPGAVGSAFITKNASTIINGHRIVRSTTAGEIGHASSQTAGHGDDTLGLSLNAAIIGSPVVVAPSGQFVTFSGWSWTPLTPIYLSSDGLLTQTPPSTLSGDLFHQQVGYAEAADTMYVQISTPIYFG